MSDRIQIGDRVSVLAGGARTLGVVFGILKGGDYTLCCIACDEAPRRYDFFMERLRKHAPLSDQQMLTHWREEVRLIHAAKLRHAI